MFDVGFTELVLLFVIGLLILGPERLPRVAAQLGRWMGKARRTAHQLRMQLEREMTMNEIMQNQKDREQSSDKSKATADKTEDRHHPEDDHPENNYPEEEDANDSGHHDAGADDADEAVGELVDEEPRSDAAANEDSSAQQRSA